MGMTAPQLKRKIQIQRATYIRGEGGSMIPTWTDFGPVLFAQRTDVKDAERIVAAHWENKLVSRFVIRASGLARSIRRSDRLMHDGIEFSISGIKEVPLGNAFIEITAEADGIA